MRRALSVLLVLFAAAAAHAKEEQAPPKADLDRAVELHAQALEALASGAFEKAAGLWEQASAKAPDAPALLYNRALALERAGKRAEAARAYEKALTGKPGEHALRSLFNLGALELDEAWGARQLLRMKDQELLDAVRRQKGGAHPGELLPEQVQQAVQGLRGQLADKGVSAGKAAVKRLRDLVRRKRDDREAVQNLELAQRTLRELRKEQERQEQAQQQQEEKGSPQDREKHDPQQEPDSEKQKESPEKQDRDEQDQQEQQQENKDQAKEEPQDQTGTQQPQPQPAAEEKDQQESNQPSSPEEAARKDAEDTLRQLLEAAARRAREVREMKRARARRTPVEKDW